MTNNSASGETELNSGTYITSSQPCRLSQTLSLILFLVSAALVGRPWWNAQTHIWLEFPARFPLKAFYCFWPERDRQMEIRILHFNFNFILCNHDSCKMNFSRSKNLTKGLLLDSKTMTTENLFFKKLEILPVPSIIDFFSIQFMQQRKLHHCSARSTSLGCLAENRKEP